MSAGELAAQANRICRTAATQAERVEGLRRLRPSAAEKEPYARWLAAEREALTAAKAVTKPSGAAKGDPLIGLTIAEGKVSGYARRLGAGACIRLQAGRMPP
jgi:hypothetical protein